MKQINSLVELAQAIEDGANIEILDYIVDGEWKHLTRSAALDHAASNIRSHGNAMSSFKIRIKPALKKIDLSGLRGKKVLCEFWSDGSRQAVGYLDDMQNGYQCELVGDCCGITQTYAHCRPLFNHPHVHTGAQLPEGFIIDAVMMDGETISGVGSWAGGFWDDVASYAITGYAEGYTL